MQSEEFRRSYASGMGRGGAAHAESEEEREDEAMLQEDFDLLDEEDARGDTRKKTRNDANETSEDISDSEEEEAQPYVGRSGKKAREEQERIKPKVRFFGVKDSKVTIPTSRKEMKKEVEKRKERRTLSLGQRAKELEKKEVQEGLIHACDVIDLIIEILRGSANVKMARACLTEGITEGIAFKSAQSQKDAQSLRFTERQADAILEMRLYKLIGLEIEALMKEHEKTLANIAEYNEILSNRAAMAKVIIRELEAYKKEYGRPRRTVIDNLKEAVVEEKKIEEMDVVFLMDRFGYAKTIDMAAYERNREAADAENRYVLTCKNTDKICIFTNKGQMHLLKVLDLPFGKFRDKGTPIDNLSNYNSSEENFVYITNLGAIRSHKLIFGTKTAMLKIVDGSEFDVAKRTTAATKLTDGDEVLFVHPVEGDETIVMQSERDFFLRIAVDTIPEKKKGAVGVRGMRLADGDALTAIHLLGEGESAQTEVKGKPVMLNRLHVAGRDTKGTKK